MQIVSEFNVSQVLNDIINTHEKLLDNFNLFLSATNIRINDIKRFYYKQSDQTIYFDNGDIKVKITSNHFMIMITPDIIEARCLFYKNDQLTANKIRENIIIPWITFLEENVPAEAKKAINFLYGDSYDDYKRTD